MLSAVTDRNDRKDGLHILEAEQSGEEEMLHTQHTLRVSEENND